MTPDSELLRQFARTNSEAAFAELVRRHVNLVYSAALRQVNGDEHSAKDVAQTVFTDLARKAGSLSRRESLIGWLYTSAHFAAAKFVRGENRRRDREETFMREPNETAPETDWERLRPTLDDAMHELKETDREAILLRYFENQPFIQVGAKLGLNENAARMRVERALEKLRAIFTKRGITTATALASVISANAIQMAPANLAATLTTTSIAAAGTGTFTLLKIMTATKLKLGISALVVAGMTTALVVQHQTQNRLRDENKLLQQLLAQLQTDNANLSNRVTAINEAKSMTDTQMNELLKLRGEVTRLENDANDPIEKSAKAWLEKVNKLKERLEETPDAKIPELKFVTEQDWLSAVRGNPLNTDVDYRRALSVLRGIEENKVANMLKKALTAYMQNNNEQSPTDLSQLQPYFDSLMDDSVLQGWEIAPANTVKNLGMGGDVIITQKAPVDDVFDSRYGVGPNGFGSTDFLQSSGVYETMQPVFAAYRSAHNGQWQTDMSQLLPYAMTPEQQAALQKMILKESASSN